MIGTMTSNLSKSFYKQMHKREKKKKVKLEGNEKKSARGSEEERPCSGAMMLTTFKPHYNKYCL